MSATFSPCRTWRYTLTRLIEPALMRDLSGEEQAAQARAHMGGEYVQPKLRTVAFIGLNPSTADETVNDQTIKKCMRFARDWGYDRLVMLNIFAYRATDPKKLYSLRGDMRVGVNNDLYLVQQAKEADLVVCAWGTHGKLNWRGAEVARMLRADDIKLHVLGLTKDAYPKHPLYLRGDLTPVEWEPGARTW